MLPLPLIQQEVERLAGKIGASERNLPTFGYTNDGARPHIEVDARGYHFIVVERGQELEHHCTQDINEVLELTFLHATFILSISYELAHRVQGRDSRRIAFARQVELLAVLSPLWAERERERHREILLQHPFDDFTIPRYRLAQQYRDQGETPEAAMRKTYERYPLDTENP